MKIESVANAPDRAGRYRVTLDSGRVLRLYRDTMAEFGLYTGRELTPEEFSALEEAAGRMSAKMRAVRIVSAANVSKKDLEQRLVRKGEAPEQAKAAVEWMAELDLVDDRRTAEQIVSRCVSRGYGPERARQALYEKQIPREYWEAALANYPDQSEHILAFLRTKLGSQWDEKDLKRAIDSLLRRGHSYEAIRQALRQLEDFREE